MTEASSLSTESLLSTLATIRTLTQRCPERTANLGQELIERGWLKSGLGDDVWQVLEQIAVGALECGRIDLADVCAARLATRFPGSPRVAVLLGQLLEAKGLTEQAREYYESILTEDETDTPIRKRLISLHLYSSPSDYSSISSAVVVGGSSTAVPSKKLSKTKGVQMLVEYLDTFYNDLEGWAELASVYASSGLYAQSLTALSHLILLAPHNPFHLLQHAETAYTLGDFPLAYKEFLRVVEMSEGAKGAGRRALFGLKVCIARLEARGTPTSIDPVLVPKKLKEVDLMATKLLLGLYKASEGAVGGDIVRQWVGGPNLSV